MGENNHLRIVDVGTLSLSNTRSLLILNNVQLIHVFFVAGEEADLTIIAAYVYDLIFITKTPETMKKIKQIFAARFKMNDLRKLHYNSWGFQYSMMKREGTYGWTRDSIFSHC